MSDDLDAGFLRGAVRGTRRAHAAAFELSRRPRDEGARRALATRWAEAVADLLCWALPPTEERRAETARRAADLLLDVAALPAPSEPAST